MRVSERDSLALSSIHSDGTALYLDPLQPKIGETVTIRVRFWEELPVERVVLAYKKNGVHKGEEMAFDRTEDGFVYYAVRICMKEPVFVYQFYVFSMGKMYTLTQRGVYTCLQDDTCSFVIRCDYEQPAWVKNSVFYQIFPERFCQGDPSLQVKDGEFAVDGFDSIRVKDWNQVPASYQQTHCLDFYGGDLKGIKEKIPYLKELGVDALYINPIFRAPSVHKYDCIDFFHVDEHFGGDEALADLCRALHENGMKIVLDISINHTGAAHRWFNRQCQFFPKSVGAYHNPEAPERHYYHFHEDGSYEGWDHVENLPALDYTAKELREILYAGNESVIRKWLREPYRIDGWRFDVADVMANRDEKQLSHEVWPELNRAIKEENPQAYILAEHWNDCAEYFNGKEWDSAMNYYGCTRVLRPFIGITDPYFEHSPILNTIPVQMAAEDVRERILDYLAKMPFVFWQNQFNLLDSHDVGRIHNYPDADLRKIRGAVILQFLLPGTPSIYYGDEALIDGRIREFEGCRYPMPWGSGFEEGEMFGLYKKLCHLRQEERVLSEGSFAFLYAQDEVIAAARYDEKDVVMAVMSVCSKEQTVCIPTGLVKRSPAQIREVLGGDARIEQMENGLRIQMGACQTLLVKF